MSLFAPGEFAHPSDQGPSSTCTRHALAKCVCDGFQKGYFNPKTVMDFKQQELIDAFINIHPNEEMKGKWPTEYDKKFLPGGFYDDTSRKTWNIQLSSVKEIGRLTFKQNLGDQSTTNALVYEDTIIRKELNLTTGIDEDVEEIFLHTVYVLKLKTVSINLPGQPQKTKEREVLECINSWKNKPYILWPLNRDGNRLYAIKCCAVTTSLKNDSQSPSVLESIDDKFDNSDCRNCIKSSSSYMAAGCENGNLLDTRDIALKITTKNSLKYIVNKEYENIRHETYETTILFRNFRKPLEKDVEIRKPSLFQELETGQQILFERNFSEALKKDVEITDPLKIDGKIFEVYLLEIFVKVCLKAIQIPKEEVLSQMKYSAGEYFLITHEASFGSGESASQPQTLVIEGSFNIESEIFLYCINEKFSESIVSLDSTGNKFYKIYCQISKSHEFYMTDVQQSTQQKATSELRQYFPYDSTIDTIEDKTLSKKYKSMSIKSMTGSKESYNFDQISLSDGEGNNLVQNNFSNFATGSSNSP